MAQSGACDVCEAIVRVSNFTAHRTFHTEVGCRDPGPCGYSDIAPRRIMH